MRKIEETDNISEMVLASFTDKEMQQDISISRILSFPGLEIHLKEQTVYKDGGIRIYMKAFNEPESDPEMYLFYSRVGGKYVKLTEPAIDKRIKIYAADAHKRCLEVPLATHAHQFRHAKATHWLEDGMNIIQIRFLLGHASLNTTMRYLDITTDYKRQALATLENEFGFVSKSKLLDFPTMPTTTESLSFIIFHKI